MNFRPESSELGLKSETDFEWTRKEFTSTLRFLNFRFGSLSTFDLSQKKFLHILAWLEVILLKVKCYKRLVEAEKCETIYLIFPSFQNLQMAERKKESRDEVCVNSQVDIFIGWRCKWYCRQLHIMSADLWSNSDHNFVLRFLLRGRSNDLSSIEASGLSFRTTPCLPINVSPIFHEPKKHRSWCSCAAFPGVRRVHVQCLHLDAVGMFE